MSMRKKAVLWLVVIVFGITAVNYALSIFLTKQGLESTIESDLKLSRDIANDLVSVHIDLLKANAKDVATSLGLAASDSDIQKIMENTQKMYPDFLAFAVLDKNGRIGQQYGAAPISQSETGSDYVKSAFDHTPAISSTSIDEETNELVMHVSVPMSGDRVLVVTIPGMFFSKILTNYKLWDSGNIFIIDGEGTMIANPLGFRDQLVLERQNYIEQAKTDPEAKEIGSFFTRMLSIKEGIGKYVEDGSEHICAYTQISSSAMHWRIAIIAPIKESPVRDVQNKLLISTLLVFVIAAAIAFFSANIVAKPYNLVQKQKEHLEELQVIAESASAAKSAFLANMSHEMRTPLNAIIGLSELTLGEEDFTGNARENIEKVFGSGMNLLGIVNDILDLSKIESGKFEIKANTYDIPSMINDTVTVNVVRIGSKPINFKIHPSADLPGKLYGDELRIKQIHNNLLSNAFKYTKEGTVDWTIYTEADEEGLWLVSEIKDTGIGIKEENIGKLFSDYYQVNKGSNQKIEGTGLGLSITRQLAQMMGGDISVKSVYGEGSTFTVRIRQGETDAPAIGVTVAENLGNFNFNDSKRARNERLVRIRMPYANVLVVDDVQTNLDVVKGILKPYGINVECVLRGIDAIERIRSEEIIFDAIFMDHMMPEMDGIEATQIIRNEIGTDYARNIPIIALTANAIVGNEKMFLDNGFQEFLSKPIDIMAMDAAIKRWVRDKDKEREYKEKTGKDAMDLRTGSTRRKIANRRSGLDRRKTEDLAYSGDMDADDIDAEEPDAEDSATVKLLAESEIDGLDSLEGLNRLGGLESAYIEVLRSYAANTPDLLTKLANQKDGTLSDYAVTVHGIKGSSRNIGAADVGTKAETLEMAAKAGDAAFVLSEHDELIRLAGKLIEDINALLQNVSQLNLKPRKDAPDTSVLEKLKAACMEFDIDGVDEAMSTLERYEYESGGELVEWLRTQVDSTGFKQIEERLGE